MDESPATQTPKPSPSDEKPIDAALDKKRFSIRKFWVISITVVTAAIGLATAIIYKDAEIKVQLGAIKSTVDEIKKVEEVRNIYIGEQIKEIKADIDELQKATFKPR